jgi:hypothetical protein
MPKQCNPLFDELNYQTNETKPELEEMQDLSQINGKHEQYKT